MPLRVSEHLSAVLGLETTAGHESQALDAFLALRPVRTAKLLSSFSQAQIKFTPRPPETKAQEIACDQDLAVCNRECERLFADRRNEMEEPCKLAVASHFEESRKCFPSTASVEERCRGKLRISDIKVGDELAIAGGGSSRVIAMLHADPTSLSLYLLIEHNGGQVVASPEHLILVRQRRSASWAWCEAQDVRQGDQLQDSSGGSLAVEAVRRVCLQGAFAPLTESGELLVEGVRCSCYSPPSDLQVSHESCHAAMLPRWLSFLDPLLTIEAMWLLPSQGDKRIHPYANSLLNVTTLAKALSDRCSLLIDGFLPASEEVDVHKAV